MEHSIFIAKISNLRYIKKKYSRLYYGNEFCERLIPSVRDLKRVVSFVKERGLDFSFVTPYVTNSGMVKLRALFELLRDRKVNCEAIINDWGVLNLINRKYSNLEPVLGRLLTKQKRGPSVIKLLQRRTNARFIMDPANPNQRFIIVEKKLPLALDPYYKGSNAARVPIIHQFLSRQGVKRIELDNTGQGVLLNLPQGKISASIYFPYVYISTTFFCPSAGCDNKRKSFLKIRPCRRQCQRYVFTLSNRSFHKIIFLRGNTHFYKNLRISYKALAQIGIDRVVYEPELPL
jgi:hypothetical protein